ncbi:EVE domain-containing protein [Streptomyces beigongshangae]|uniref:EVE domain-containing protein n=1 Tax=Streptomyces beigongshangae TaxID=2841597 RepID=UPI001C845233|nr:EVE domain-containing protein [Streptomyces sp. REN17]
MDWLFIVKPEGASADGGSSAKDRMLALAETAPRREWCLSRWRRMAPGDRLWIYFASPVREIAAVADIEDEPYEVTGSPRQPWKFTATLDPAATRRLHRDPVPLHVLSNRNPQGVTRVKEKDLGLLLDHAGL